jgi:hypothetical protein
MVAQVASSAEVKHSPDFSTRPRPSTITYKDSNPINLFDIVLALITSAITPAITVAPTVTTTPAVPATVPCSKIASISETTQGFTAS